MRKTVLAVVTVITVINRSAKWLQGRMCVTTTEFKGHQINENGSIAMFRTPETAQRLICSHERVVCMSFFDGKCLYVHPAILKAWSPVMANLLDDVESNRYDVESNRYDEGDHEFCLIGGGGGYETRAAWEDALQLMHPGGSELKVDWDNTRRLLELSHKYDMPGIAGHVVSFLEEQVPLNDFSSRPGTASSATPHGPTCLTVSQLTAHLDSKNVLDWLQLFSSCSLDAQARECNAFMARAWDMEVLEKPSTMSYLYGIVAAYADQLLTAVASLVPQCEQK